MVFLSMNVFIIAVYIINHSNGYYRNVYSEKHIYTYLHFQYYKHLYSSDCVAFFNFVKPSVSVFCIN